ncbi:MAG: hypothetical protein CNF02_03020 [OM182 bacterium MED-G28]|uniref:DUF2232 domain-containing protein n=1 Tax=OM182 bacterium MED-G28 TaxID=1986256 RepID=A0A2A5WFI5_9GAMM|nr:MAG: hypothetical protein CNF02_03020 [OM182 bacterium MED-G28]
MRGLAQFVMTGRKQAIIAAGLLGLIPLINLLSPAVVGIVMLRKGLQEATFVFIWGALPLVVWAMLGDIVPLVLLFGITGLTWLLRETESWEFTFLAAIAIGLVIEIYLRLQPAVLDAVFQQLQPYFQQNNLQGMEIEEIRETMTTIIGSVYMFLAIVLTMLARWMQASLFNPGGFQSEIHQLRIKQKVALILLGFMLLCSFGILIPQAWVLYFMIPLVFSGVGLLHAVVAKRKMSSMVLVVFYVLLMLPVVIQVVVLLALIDSWYDFRARLDQVG